MAISLRQIFIIASFAVAAHAEDLPTLEVTLTPVSQQFVRLQRSAQGTLVSRNHTSVSAEISARVTEIHFDVGDIVEKGETLMALDCRDYELALQQQQAGLKTLAARIQASRARSSSTAMRGSVTQSQVVTAQARLPALQAQLRLEQTQLGRNRQLRRQQLITQEQLDQSQARYDSALSNLRAAQAEVRSVQAQFGSSQADTKASQADVSSIASERSALKAGVESARIQVSRCAVKAPFNGQVTERFVQLGQMAFPASPAFRLLQTDDMEVEAKLSTDDLIYLREGAAVSLQVGSESIPLKFRAAVAAVEGQSKLLRTRFKLLNTTSLPAGLRGRLIWHTEKALPAQWLVRRDGALGLMVQDNETAAFYPLPNAVEGQPILEDLPADLVLIDGNRLRVRDGQAISW